MLPITYSYLIGFGNFDYPLSGCQFQKTFGFPAPSCGLSRSFVAFASGDWLAAIQYHLFGPFFFLLFCYIIAVSVAELQMKRSLMALYRYLLDYRSILSIFFLMLAYYSLRLYARYSAVELPFELDQTVAWQFFQAGAEAL